jgi:hypothetical protein
LLPSQKPYWSATKGVIDGNNNQLKTSVLDIQKDLETNLKFTVK